MKYCEHIAHTLSFNVSDVLPCCTPCCYNSPKYFNSKVESLDAINCIDIDEKQKTMLSELNSEKLEQFSCKNCEFLKEIENLEENNKINTIFLRQWHIEQNEEDSQPSFPLNYNAYNILKKLYDTNKIDKDNLVIKIQAEKLENSDEFEGYMSIFEQYGFKELHFVTNGIVYQPTIERLIQNYDGSVNVSFVAGTKETHKNITNKDNFDTIVENIKNYGINIDDKYGLCVHYILIKGVNDNKEEINNFISLMFDLNVGSVGLRLDKPEDKNPAIVSYFYKEAKKCNFNIDSDIMLEKEEEKEEAVEEKPKKQGFFAWLLSFFK